MSADADAAARYAKAREHLREIASALFSLSLEGDPEAREVSVAEFMARTGWSERNARLGLDAELRDLSFTPEEREIETARLLLRILKRPG